MLDTYIVTMHNAREEFYNNQVLIKLNIIPHSTKHPDFANPKAPSWIMQIPLRSYHYKDFILLEVPR